MKKLLLVDDNKKYADILDEHYIRLGYKSDWALNAADGLKLFRENPADHYSVIVTDITMESQLAGIHMLGKIHKLGYGGTVVVASTGFDVFGVIGLSRLMLRSYGVHYLIPKTTVLKREPLFYPMAFGSEPTTQFSEIVNEDR